MVRTLKNLFVHRSAALLSVDMLLLFVATNVLQHYLIRLNIDVVGHSANQITVPILATIMATLAIATMGFYQWDFCWDRRSWILRIIVACLLIAAISGRFLLYPDGASNWADAQIRGVGVSMTAVVARVGCSHAVGVGRRLVERLMLLILNGNRAAN